MKSLEGITRRALEVELIEWTSLINGDRARGLGSASGASVCICGCCRR